MMDQMGTTIQASRILVVDDDPIMLGATSRLLRAAGYEVMEAASGEEGLQLAAELRPKLVLLDVMLPDMNGLEVCRRINADPSLAGISIVFLSSSKTDSDDQAEGLEVGGDGYIVRPISNRELLARVKAIFRIREAEARARRAEAELQQANAQLQVMLQEADQRQVEIDLINRMLGLLASCVTVQEAYPIIARFAQELLPGWSGALFLLDPERRLVEAVSVWGAPLEGELVFSSQDCWAIRRGAAHVSSQDMVCRHLSGSPTGNYLCIPLNALGESLGVLHLQAPSEPPERFADNLRNLAVIFSNHIALSLANLNLQETLSHQAIIDHLTGLFNRRYLGETLEREMRRSKRKDAPLALIMLDLDHFKRFNDTYGHEAGDNLLRALGIFLKNHIRQEDVPCRYGGEEFVLILPETTLAVALKRAEEIREKVPQLPVNQRGQLLESATVSLGVAIFPDHGATGEELLRAADDAMYQAKRGGRDRVVVAGSIMGPSSVDE